MSAEAILFLVLALVATVAFLGMPFFMRNGSSQIADRERLSLIAAYERTLVTVREIDEDYQVGKLPQESYESERAKWVTQGAALLEKIESIGGTSPAAQRKERRA